jgi:crotonobetainyl-CoA:carnitine CoA-transferase CaiB-like acyl-CoA transferase
MSPALQSATIDDWLKRLAEAGIPAGRIRTIDEVYSWNQVEHLGLIDTVDHPTLGKIRLPGAPLRFGRSGRPNPQPPPVLGQHTAEVLQR